MQDDAIGRQSHRTAIEQSEGLDAIVELEGQLGFDAAQEQVGLYLSDRDFRPLADMLAERLEGTKSGGSVGGVLVLILLVVLIVYLVKNT